LDGNDLIFIPAEVITSNHLEELSLQTSKIETNKSQIESLHPLVTRWMEKRKSLLNKFEQEIVESQLRKENARNILEINMLMCGLPDESNFFGWKSCSPALCVPTPDRHKTLLLSHPIHSELFIKKLISDPVFREIMEGYQIKLKMSKSLSCKETIQITSEEKCVDEIKPQNKLDRTKKNKSCLVLESEGQAIVMQVMAELSEEYRKNIAGVQVLDMSNIGLTFLSPAIRHFKKLERLFLENNHLCELPDEIGELKNLTFLALGGNELFRLPASIRKISKLGGITLDGNSLDPNEKLPLFEAMRKLHVLSIDDPEIIMQLYNRCKRNHEKLARLTKMLAVSLNLPREEKPKTKEAPNRGLPLLTLLRGKEENEPKKKHRHKNHLLPPPMPDRVPNLKLPAIAGTTKAITSRT
ncbi:leucine-rich repeat domain-containing protein, partial [bacterium]|nr:leucine-rich repeat domain-containing protein [bacterium]